MAAGADAHCLIFHELLALGGTCCSSLPLALLLFRGPRQEHSRVTQSTVAVALPCLRKRAVRQSWTACACPCFFRQAQGHAHAVSQCCKIQMSC